MVVRHALAVDGPFALSSFTLGSHDDVLSSCSVGGRDTKRPIDDGTTQMEQDTESRAAECLAACG